MNLATMRKLRCPSVKPKIGWESLRAEKGISRIGVLFFVFLVAACVFVGNQVLPFYYYYYEIQGLFETQAAKASVFSDREIRKVLRKKIKHLEIPMDDLENLKISRFSGKITIELEYNEVLYIDLGDDRVYDLWVFRFHPFVERDY